ncbi:complement C1q tumor necrosis factor-related protein 3-like isoform X1 [Scyliorhinus canicula]|uniref:complement C1q tumor necrosis factor-related protein 3-like isoform X1 n=1 Tax=Scyliorhinus canicula TaxID=7830 RepID=UPI0018F2840C|nr:complement C1q tumor necrosis factor-related protein 3-like isoform X1 [Scyliorhinus canicula]
MTDMGKVFWLFSILCHFAFQTATHQDCTGLVEISFQEIKDALVKVKEIDVLTNRIADLETKLATLKNYVPSVIFHAKVSNNKNPETKKHIIYDSIILNKGSAYSPSTGKFTAPVSGTYWFAYSLLGLLTAQNTVVSLMRNQEKQSYIHSVLNQSQAQTAAMITILPLHKGDKVWLNLQKGKAWTGDGSLSFQGVLLEASEA